MSFSETIISFLLIFSEIEIKSTITEDLQLDVCSECHPFYTGKQKVMDVGGRIDRFNKRFSSRSSK